MNIYVGNLSPEVTNDDLVQAFEKFGRVKSGRIVNEKFSTVSRGFGFVEMHVNSEAKTAIDALNGTELKGRTMIVNEARPGRGGGGRRNR